MTTLDEIRRQLPLPQGFGPDAPYVRVGRAQDDHSAGEDITVEFQASEHEGEPPLIVFSHTEWRDTIKGLGTTVLCAATIDGATGEPRAESERDRAALAEQILAALKNAGQMQRHVG